MGLGLHITGDHDRQEHNCIAWYSDKTDSNEPYFILSQNVIQGLGFVLWYVEERNLTEITKSLKSYPFFVIK